MSDYPRIEMGRTFISFEEAERTFKEFVEKHSYMYGRLMQIISQLWQEKDPVGALTVGPCAYFVNVVGTYHSIQDRMEAAEKEVLELQNTLQRGWGSALHAVIEERQRQNVIWGEQNHDPVYWLGILGEEFGELCQAINETVFDNGPEERKKGGYHNMRAEAVQVAAVAVAFIEMLDRRYGVAADSI